MCTPFRVSISPRCSSAGYRKKAPKAGYQKGYFVTVGWYFNGTQCIFLRFGLLYICLRIFLKPVSFRGENSTGAPQTGQKLLLGVHTPVLIKVKYIPRRTEPMLKTSPTFLRYLIAHAPNANYYFPSFFNIFNPLLVSRPHCQLATTAISFCFCRINIEILEKGPPLFILKKFQSLSRLFQLLR